MKTLILKSLNACNLRCDYCCLGEIESPCMLSESDMLAALRFYAEYLISCGESIACVIFHGGEPMLVPAEQYGNCINTVTREFPELEFRFSMQTNGTILSQAYIDLFRTHDIRVGISLDGSKVIHDSQRRDANGQTTYDRIMENLRKLQANDIPVAALMVVTKRALGESLDYLMILSEMKISLKINPLLAFGSATEHPELSLDAGDYGRYLARVFEYAAVNDLDIHISPLEELLNAILRNDVPRGCQFDPLCSKNFLCIDPKGDIYPCGRFADQHKKRIGDIRNGITLEGKRTLLELEARRMVELPPKCLKCKYLQYCNAGCNADCSFNAQNSQACSICEDQRYIMHYLRTHGLEIIRKSLLEQREKLQAHNFNGNGFNGL